MPTSIKKEIYRLVFSICFWCLFLIITTVFWYFPQQERLENSMAYAYQNPSFYLKPVSESLFVTMEPTSDELGLSMDAYSFQVVNDLPINVTYRIYFKNDVTKLKDVSKSLPPSCLRYQLMVGEEAYPIRNLNLDGLVFEGTLPAYEVQNFSIRVWLDQNAQVEPDYEFVGLTYLESV